MKYILVPDFDVSVHDGTSDGMTLPKLMQYINDKGRSFLLHQYMQIKSETPDGTFAISRYIPHSRKVSKSLTLLLQTTQ